MISEICSHIGMNYRSGQEVAAGVKPHHLFGSFGLRTQLEEGELRIKAKPNFSSDFERGREVLEARIAQDYQVSYILDELETRRVDRAPHDKLVPSFNRPLVMPAWYYAQRAKGVLRRAFPAEFKAPELSSLKKDGS